MEEGIATARARLTGGFEETSGYDDARATLDDMVRALPPLRDKYERTKSTHAACRIWLAQLPASTVLETVETSTEGHPLASVRARLKALASERENLQAGMTALERVHQAS